MTKHLLLAALDLLIAIAPMSMQPRTIRVVDQVVGVEWAYDETGSITFSEDYSYQPGPFKIHDFIDAAGDKYFLIINESGERKRALIKANDEEQARTTYAKWSSSQGVSVKKDALICFEVFQ